MLSGKAVYLREHVVYGLALAVGLADEHGEEQLDYREVEQLCEYPD